MSRSSNAVKAASVLAVLFVVACTDETPTDFGDPSPSPAIVDAVNGNGNPFVFFKPPVVAEPSSDLFGDFNPDLRPVVEVCHVVDQDTCTVLTTNDDTETPARFTLDGGPGGESVIVDPVAEEYQVEIHFALFDLVQDETYRIVVQVGLRQLAFADITVVNPREMRNADTGSNIVFTNDQRTVPVKVRIDDGAMCWDGPDGAEVVSCASSTTQAGEEETVSLTSSDGEEVDFHLPAGWTATVEGEEETELTISIEEVPAQFVGPLGDPACFNNFELGDPDTGEPANCYKVRADTDDATDVTVEFGGSLPILAFCPSADVLQAIADGIEGWIMTSVEEDQEGTTTRTYDNTAPASDFGGCGASVNLAMEGGALTRFASAAWRHVRPILSPLLPQPLHAADIGFGGSIDRLATIFFWSRTPVDLDVQPAPASVAVGSTLQLTPDPIFHEGASEGGTFQVQWDADDTNIATVDADGLVTGVAEGTTQITATATDILDPSLAPVSGSTTLTVTAPVPTLLSPTSGTVIPQNDPTNGCSLIFENRRGFGYQVFFDWTDVAGADAYEVTAGFPSASVPFLHPQTVSQSEFLHVSCNAIAGTAEDAEWQVRAITNGVPGPWSEAEPFTFDDCVLESGDPCGPGTWPIGFEILPDGSVPVSGQSVTTQFQDLGVTFSYVRADEGAGTPRICDSTGLSPAGVASDHSVTFDDQTGSGANACSPATLGTITMTFGVATTAVEFTLSFPQGATLDLTAMSKSGAALSFTTVSSTNYTTQNSSQWTEVHYRVDGDVGFIDVSQATGGALMLIDEVHVQP